MMYLCIFHTLRHCASKYEHFIQGRRHTSSKLVYSCPCINIVLFMAAKQYLSIFVAPSIHLSLTRSLSVNVNDHVMNVNVRGMALALKNASRAMIDSKTRGVIICTASTSSVVGGTTHIEYTTSKHAVLGLMRAATSNLGKYGIRVNCVSPSTLVTPLCLNYFCDDSGGYSLQPHVVQDFVNSLNVLVGHTFSTSDVAKAVLYLASDDAAFVNGHNLVIDGGITTKN